MAPTWYSRDLNVERLVVNLQMLTDMIRRHGEREGTPIKRVTNVQTICASMNSKPVAKTLCSEAHRLLLLYLTVPVTTLTTERTFSVQQRVETYLRSSMTQQRLNNFILSTVTKKGLMPLICFKLLLFLWEQMSGEQCTLVVWRSKYIPVIRLLCYTCAQCDCVLNTVLGRVDLSYLALLHNKHIRLSDYHPLIPQTTNCTKHEISCKQLSHQMCIILDTDKATTWINQIMPFLGWVIQPTKL